MRRITILGMGRSGTSFLSEFLDKCGVYADEVNWAHEHEFGRLINDTILAQQFGARPGLPYGKLPNKVLTIQQLDYWKMLTAQMVRYIETCAQVEGASAWVFKDPRTTLLHEIWLEHFDVLIGMYRPPQEVIASYLGQKWITGLRKKRIALEYWKTFNRHLLEILRGYQGKKTTFLLPYDEHVARNCVQICEQLGIPVTPEARALYQKDLKHYTSREFPRDNEAREIYHSLEALSRRAA
jgi:hypothetical protein